MKMTAVLHKGVVVGFAAGGVEEHTLLSAKAAEPTGGLQAIPGQQLVEVDVAGQIDEATEPRQLWEVAAHVQLPAHVAGEVSPQGGLVGE